MMDKKPSRSWAKIYTQMWNIALTDPIVRTTGHPQHTGSMSTPGSKTKHNDWRDRCCWRFNKGNVLNTIAGFDHRCSVKDCGSYTHSAQQCNKKKSTTVPSGRNNNQGRN